MPHAATLMLARKLTVVARALVANARLEVGELSLGGLNFGDDGRIVALHGKRTTTQCMQSCADLTCRFVFT